MAIAEGSQTDFIIKEESTANTQETGSGGTRLRRVTGAIPLAKAEVQSQEKRNDFMEQNTTHGTRSGTFNFTSELFSGSYQMIVEAFLRKNVTDGITVSADMSISSGVVTRAAGSFITDGLKKGMVGRFASMGTSGNLSRNCRVGAVTATTFAVTALDGGAAIADDAGPNGSATFTVTGATCHVPETAHTSKTFTIERRDKALGVSEVARGAKVGTLGLNVQPNSPVGITFSGNYIDRARVDGGQVLTSPSDTDDGAAFSGAIGVARVGGNIVSVITGFSLDGDNGLQAPPVVFSNISPDVFYGNAGMLTGQITMFRDSITLQDAFDDETDVELELFLEAPGTAPLEFFSIYAARVKINGDTLDDPDGPATVTLPFRILKPRAEATGELYTTLLIQDSGFAE